MRFLSRTATSLLLPCILIILLLPIKTPFNYYDEGLAVFNAARVMDGEVPYRDFWAIYPPGQFYALAAIFKAFGTSLLVARIYDTIVVRFVIAIGAFLVAKRIAFPILALPICITTGLLLSSAGFYAYAVYPSLALGLLSILSSLEHAETGQRRWLLLAGTLAGIASFFRWDVGLYGGVSVVAAVFLFQFSRVDRETNRSSMAFLVASEMVLLVLGAASAVVLLGYGYLSIRSGFGNLWDQLAIFPTTILHDMRWKPYPALVPPILSISDVSAFRSAYSELSNWLRFYSPLAIYGMALGYYSHSFATRRIILNVQHFGTIGVTIFGVLLFAQALSRYDYIHVVPTSIMASLAIVSLFCQALRISSSRSMKVFLPLLLTGLAVLYFGSPIESLLSSIKTSAPLGCYSQLKRAGCIYVAADQERAVEYVRTHTQEEDPIFVGNRRHDLIFVNDAGFYFLSDRPSATYYGELYPGVATTLPAQKVIAHEIESKDVNWIVLVNIPESGEPNASAISSGVHYLDDFIRSRYLPVAVFGGYEIWERATR